MPRFDEDEDKMVDEDLSTDFTTYLAVVLQINVSKLDESELEAFDNHKSNFLRCPCCAPESD